jgi:hypothetical protein
MTEDATIPYTTLKFARTTNTKYGGFVWTAEVSIEQIGETESIFGWCNNQFGPPYSAVFEGYGNDAENMRRVGAPHNRRWAFDMSFPVTYSTSTIPGQVEIIFYNNEDATLFQMIISN